MTDVQSVAAIPISEIADAIQRLGFSCTDCGACCRSDADGDHVATIFPEEVRRLRDRVAGSWDDVARPMPFGLDDRGEGETFEWALQVDGCGDCAFYRPDADGGRCGVYTDRPEICRTYPFQLAVPDVTNQNAAIVERSGPVLAYECEGLGRDIDRKEARAMARRLKRRAIQEIEQREELIARYDPPANTEGVVVHDSEGPKAADGTPLDSP